MFPFVTQLDQATAPTKGVGAAAERHRFGVVVETMLACFNNPTIICNQPTSAVPPPLDWLAKNRMLIELERAARLMKLVKRKPNASLDEIRECAKRLTNPEICGILSVISGAVPPGSDVAAEYMRAFAHCVELDQFVELIARDWSEPLNLLDIESFYYHYGGRGGWGWLDDDERQWIKDFNQKARARREELRTQKTEQAP